MSYQSCKEWSVRILNQYNWPASCSIRPCTTLHNSVLRPSGHSWSADNCLRYVMDSKEKQLEQQWWGSQDILIKMSSKNLHAVNCRPKALECISATSPISQTTSIVLHQKLRCNEAFGCKWLYIDMTYWLWITTLWILTSIIEHRITVKMCLWWASMEHQWVLVFNYLQSMGCMVTSVWSKSNGHL